jgi:phospholipase C
MTDRRRREFLKLATRSASAAAALSAFPPSISRALALPAANVTGTIADVEHIVILMQENRSFDHYFGTLRGVRGFGDRHPVPLASGKPVWHQADGDKEIPPFRLDSETTSALKVASTPHSFGDAQAAWNQGRFGAWPQFKTPISMGHYQREDIPFQFALAEAFTICDAHHCSITTGTDPNRIVLWSGSNFDPERCRRGENCTEEHAEPDNLRCWIVGVLPEPGYTYSGSALTWPTIPDVLQQAGISWRIYQDPNDNWTGAMHGGLAFESFRTAKPGSPLYENGMRHWSLEQLADDVKANRLPKVSWVLPSQKWSEHPAGSSPVQGAEFTSRVLDALTANPEVWGKTVFFLTFDENDGLFDHVPPPAPPSYNPDGTLAGKSTLVLDGHYFSDPERKHLDAKDPATGTVRPWGMGPRVPLYVISPWSRGGWVNSQVFDHTSIGQFIEKRFGVTVPAISPWHRAVSGDLTSAFDFAAHADAIVPELPRVRGSASIIAAVSKKPQPAPPPTPERLFQETGTRRSRALPYTLEVDAQSDAAALQLTFHNTGKAGAVFHVYDRLHLDRIPRRYTVEAGKTLTEPWDIAADKGQYDLWIYGPNGFVRECTGKIDSPLRVIARYDTARRAIHVSIENHSGRDATVEIRANAYRPDGPSAVQTIDLKHGAHKDTPFPLAKNHNWYDFTIRTVRTERSTFTRRFAGRLETGTHDISDPAG